MNAFSPTVVAKQAFRTSVLSALLLGLVAAAPARAQESERAAMNRLHEAVAAKEPPPLEHSGRSMLSAGTELLLDGGFEGGYYGGDSTVATSGVTGPWIWSNSPSWLNPIWENYGSTYARTGNFMAYFNPIGPSQAQLAQKVSIPSGVTATLSFWLKFSGAAGGNYADVFGVNFCDMNGNAIPGFTHNYRDADSKGFSWVNYSYDVSAFAGQTVYLLFWTNLTGDTVYQLDDVSLAVLSATPAPSADFSFSPSNPVPGQPVSFTDTSTGGPTSWSWSFGDGTTSTSRNPSHTYSSAGTYTVTLTAGNSAGTNSRSHSVTVAASSAPIASFSFTPSSPFVSQTVQFTDMSTGGAVSWYWTFGDNGGSISQNPTHAYVAPGTYTVTLAVSSASGSNSTSQSVTVRAAGSAPVAAFTFSPTNPAPGQPVAFTDTSSGTPTAWSWSFGDGSVSTLQNPSHSYDLTGVYSVTLIASNNGGNNASSRTLQVAAAPAQAFTYVLPSSAHSAGANGAFYTTDLSISNRGTTTANVTLQFVGHDQDGTGGLQQARTLSPGASITYADVLGSLFGVTSGYGGLLIKTDSAALKVVGQTSTPPPSGLGAFGQSVPGLTSASFVTTSTSQSLIALREDSASRTNAVVMNVSPSTAHVRLVLLGANASTLGSSEFDLAPLAMRQISSVVTTLGAPAGTTNAVLVVSTTTSGAQVACYATVIDNVTNDPRTILP